MCEGLKKTLDPSELELWVSMGHLVCDLGVLGSGLQFHNYQYYLAQNALRKLEQIFWP